MLMNCSKTATLRSQYYTVMNFCCMLWPTFFLGRALYCWLEAWWMSQLEWRKAENENSHVSMLVFWIVMPCGFVDIKLLYNILFHYIHVHYGLVGCDVMWSRPQDVTTQMTTVNIFTAVRTSVLLSSKQSTDIHYSLYQ